MIPLVLFVVLTPSTLVLAAWHFAGYWNGRY